MLESEEDMWPGVIATQNDIELPHTEAFRTKNSNKLKLKLSKIMVNVDPSKAPTRFPMA